MKMTAKGCRKLAMTTVLIAVMLCQSIIQCYSFYEGGWGWGVAYKSMSWSTSSRERAKLGRLDSEPPLLLREWPPETWEFFRPVTGIGSNSSSSVPASALACWGSKSEMRRDESALGCAQSPDNRLKSSKAEAAEVGAEDTEEVALLPAGGADGPEIREQPRRESSAVRGFFADSSTEPPKGSDKDNRSGSMSEDVSGDLSPSISFSGASDSSRVRKGSGTTNSESPESTSRIADGLSTVSCSEFSTVEACKPGINSSQDAVTVSEGLSLGFLSSVLNSSAVRLEKLSSSNGFHVGCVGVLVAQPEAGTVGPALLWSWTASPTPA